MKALTKSFALLLLALAAASASAQSFTGTVSGVVTDEQGGALPGATVTLSGKGAPRTTVSDAKGEYRFTAVDPGSYTITAELTGFRRKEMTNVPVSIGKTAEGHFTLTVGGKEESIEVLGESPLVDVTSSATDNNLSQDILFNFPIRYGNVATALLNNLPGVNNQSAYGGDSSSGNALLIDGVDTRDPDGGTAWTFYNFNIVQEVQAVGIGAPAEFGAFSGAVINTVTKSGGNRYGGLFDVTFTNSGLNGNNISDTVKKQNPTLSDPAKTEQLLDVTTQLSGPLVKDKLFFFLSAQRYHLKQNPSGPTTLRDEVSPRFNGKLTWQPSSNDIVNANVQFDSYNIIGRCGVAAAQCTDDLTNQEDAPEWVWLTSWRHLFGSKTFTEVKYTGWWGYYDLTPKVHAPQHNDGATNLITVSQGWAYSADRGRHQVNGSITHYAEGFGRHDLKFGVEIERSKSRNRYLYANNTYYYDYGGHPYYAYGYGYDINGRNRRESVFAQDGWKPNDRLTLNLGVRMDHVSGGEPGKDSAYSNTMFAPRVGFAFDLTGDHTTVLKGSYSQYYEGIFNDVYKAATSGYADRITWNMAGCPDYGPQGPTVDYNCPLADREEVNRVSQPVGRVDPNIKHPRVDEWSLGLERQFGQNWRVSATGIYRDNKNFIGSVLPDARWTATNVTSTASPTVDGCSDCSALPATTVTGYRWANRATSADNLLITNPNGFRYLDPNGNVLGTMNAYRNYKALMFTLGRRYADRWQGQVSYVYSKSRGTVNNTSEGLFSRSSFYETPTLALTNSDGVLTNDRPHEVKAFLGYEIPKVDISVNAMFRSISGPVYTPFQRFSSSTLNYSLSGYYFGFSSGRQPSLEPRGSRRLPTETVLDLRLEKVFNVGGSNRIAVFGDVLNLTNAGTVTGRLARVPSTTLPLPPPAELGSTEAIPFEAPSSIRAPRQINLGARWSF
jgi:carboxypeptidase family protein/TonB-dependent receptor-like protein